MHYRLAAVDNDGTLHPAKGVWKYLQQPLELFDETARTLLEASIADELPYSEMVERTIARWAGIPAARFIGVLESLPLRPHSLQLLQRFRAMGMRIVTLSSGVHWWEEVWRGKYGVTFDHYRANVVEVDARGRCTGRVKIQVTDDNPLTNKGVILASLQAEWGITREETLALGDGTGDIPLFRQSGRSFCISPSGAKVVSATSDGELSSGDFAELIDRLPMLAETGDALQPGR